MYKRQSPTTTAIDGSAAENHYSDTVLKNESSSSSSSHAASSSNQGLLKGTQDAPKTSNKGTATQGSSSAIDTKDSLVGSDITFLQGNKEEASATANDLVPTGSSHGNQQDDDGSMVRPRCEGPSLVYYMLLDDHDLNSFDC